MTFPLHERVAPRRAARANPAEARMIAQALTEGPAS